MLLSLAVLLVASSCLVAGASGLHITWLPLGDSITWGCGNGVLPHFEPPGCRATSKHLNDCASLDCTTRILGRRAAPFPPFRITYCVPHGFTPRS